MRWILLIAAVFYVGWRLAKRADHWLAEPHALARRARAYEYEQLRRRGFERGYEGEG